MPIEVILNVYDLIEQTPLCCGFFHTGVEILGCEYSFGQGGGVYECTPKSAPDGNFRESIVMGTIENTSTSRAALDRLRGDFPGDSYNVIFKNCNDFCTAYVKAVLNKNIPGRINRLARIGRMWPIRCFLPPHLKGNVEPTRAPLLAAQPQQELFQGAGQSLRGGSSSSSVAGSGVNSAAPGAMACIGNKIKGMFSRGGANAPVGTSSSNSSLVREDANARELRAAAATRRLEGSDDSEDLETPGSTRGMVGTPMPNPWQ